MTTANTTTTPHHKFNRADLVSCKKPGFEDCLIMDADFDHNVNEWNYQVISSSGTVEWFLEAEISLHKSTVSKKSKWTARELLETNLPEPEWIIEDFLPEGATLLASRPKMGKSWLALQVAHAVAYGQPLFGRQVKQGKVLYLALEDSPVQIKSRLQAQNWPAKGGENIVFYYEWKHFDKGGFTDLVNELKNDNYRLVVIDTFSRAISINQNQTHEVTAALAPLQRLAKGFSILIVDHHSKMRAEDPIDSVLGSTGKTAVVDTIMGLYRANRLDKMGTLKALGRMTKDIEWALKFNGSKWELLGDAWKVAKNNNETAILEAIKMLGDKATKLEDIAAAARVSLATASRTMKGLKDRGLIKWDGPTHPYIIITDPFEIANNVVK